MQTLLFQPDQIIEDPKLQERALKDEDRQFARTRMEKNLMIAELELDGIKTHITMRKDKCPFYESAFDVKIRQALSAVRSARDFFRMLIGSKQWTLTTRSPSANRHGLWQLKVYRNWRCPACHVAEGKPDNYGYYDHIGLGTDNCVYEDSELTERGLLDLHLALLEDADLAIETAPVIHTNSIRRSKLIAEYERSEMQ